MTPPLKLVMVEDLRLRGLIQLAVLDGLVLLFMALVVSTVNVDGVRGISGSRFGHIELGFLPGRVVDHVDVVRPAGASPLVPLEARSEGRLTANRLHGYLPVLWTPSTCQVLGGVTMAVSA